MNVICTMHSPSQAAEAAASTVPFKLAILSLLEGTYGDACIKTVGSENKGAGTPMVFSPGGLVSWGSGSTDLSKGTASNFSLLVSHTSSMSAFAADQKKPGSEDRSYVVGLGTTVDDATTAATVTDETHSPSTGMVCSSKTVPKSKGASLWPIAAKFINFTDKKMKCYDSKTGASEIKNVLFTGAQAAIGTMVWKANSPQDSETLGVNDDEPMGGLNYSVTNTAGSKLIVAMHADRTIDSVVVSNADLSGTMCNPE